MHTEVILNNATKEKFRRSAHRRHLPLHARESRLLLAHVYRTHDATHEDYTEYSERWLSRRPLRESSTVKVSSSL
jgi:hypothetical protein